MRTLIKQTLPVLLLTGIGTLFAGAILSQMRGALELVPGLIVIIPAIISLRGDVSAALGSRLGSAIHLGLIDAKKLFNVEVQENLKASLTLSAFVALFVGVLGYLSCRAIGLRADIFELTFIALFSGVVSGIILALITLGIVSLAFKRGLDPDNVTSPALTTIGDIITMLCVFIAVLLVEAMHVGI